MLRLYMDVPINAVIRAGLHRQGIDVVTAQADESTYARIRALLERGRASSRCGAVTRTIAWLLPGHV
jgi:hypothetical protein